MDPSIPFNSPFMSLSFSRMSAHVCPFLSLPVISRHLPSCHLVSLSFVCLAVPPHSPCFHFCTLHVPFSSPSCPFQFPFMSLSDPLRFPFISHCFPVMSTFCPLHVLAFPIISCPHFPALPCIFPSLPGIFPNKKHGFSAGFRKHDVKNTELFQIFGKRRQKTRTSKEPAGGFAPGTPVLRQRLPEYYF